MWNCSRLITMNDISILYMYYWSVPRKAIVENITINYVSVDFFLCQKKLLKATFCVTKTGDRYLILFNEK